MNWNNKNEIHTNQREYNIMMWRKSNIDESQPLNPRSHIEAPAQHQQDSYRMIRLNIINTGSSHKERDHHDDFDIVQQDEKKKRAMTVSHIKDKLQ
jgi:hypothetical protein